jgi:hypothetical protein
MSVLLEGGLNTFGDGVSTIYEVVKRQRNCHCERNEAISSFINT